MKMNPGEVLPKGMYRDVRPDPTLSVFQTSQKTITYFGSATNLTMLMRGKSLKSSCPKQLFSHARLCAAHAKKNPYKGVAPPPPLRYQGGGDHEHTFLKAGWPINYLHLCCLRSASPVYHGYRSTASAGTRVILDCLKNRLFNLVLRAFKGKSPGNEGVEYCYLEVFKIVDI